MTTNTTTYSQPSAAPTRKVKAGIIAGKIVTVVFGIGAILYPEVYERIPAGFELAVGGLITTLVQDIASYWTKENA